MDEPVKPVTPASQGPDDDASTTANNPVSQLEPDNPANPRSDDVKGTTADDPATPSKIVNPASQDSNNNKSVDEDDPASQPDVVSPTSKDQNNAGAATVNDPASQLAAEQSLLKSVRSGWLSQARSVFKVTPVATQVKPEAEAERSLSPTFGVRYNTRSPTFIEVAIEHGVPTERIVPITDCGPTAVHSRATGTSTRARGEKKKERRRKQQSPYRRPIVIAPARLTPLPVHPGTAQPVVGAAAASNTQSKAAEVKKRDKTESASTENRGTKRSRTAGSDLSDSDLSPRARKRPPSARPAAHRASRQIADMASPSRYSTCSQDFDANYVPDGVDSQEELEEARRKVEERALQAQNPASQFVRHAKRNLPATASRAPGSSESVSQPSAPTAQATAAASSVPAAAHSQVSQAPARAAVPAVLPQAPTQRPDLAPVHAANRTPKQLRYQFIADVRALIGHYAGFGGTLPHVDPQWRADLVPLIKDIMSKQPQPRHGVSTVMLSPPNSYPIKNATLPLIALEISAPDLALLITMESTTGMAAETLDKLLISDHDTLAEYLSRFAENECPETPRQELPKPTSHQDLMSRSGYPGVMEYGQKSVSWLGRRDAIRFDTHAQTVAVYVNWLREKESAGIVLKACHDTNQCENCASMDKQAYEQRVAKFKKEWAATKPYIAQDGRRVVPVAREEKGAGAFLLHPLICNSARVWHWHQQVERCKLPRPRTVNQGIRTGLQMRKGMVTKAEKRQGKKPTPTTALRTNPELAERVKQAIKENNPALLIAPLPAAPGQAAPPASTSAYAPPQLPLPFEEPVRRATTWRERVTPPAGFLSTTDYRKHTRLAFQLQSVESRREQTQLVSLCLRRASAEEIAEQQRVITECERSLAKAREQYDRACAMTVQEGGRISPAQFRVYQLDPPEPADTHKQLRKTVTSPPPLKAEVLAESSMDTLVPYTLAANRIANRQPVLGTINVSPLDRVDDINRTDGAGGLEEGHAGAGSANAGTAGEAPGSPKPRVDSSIGDEHEANVLKDLANLPALIPFKHDDVLSDHSYASTRSGSIVTELAASDELHIVLESAPDALSRAIGQEVCREAGKDMAEAQDEESFTPPVYDLPSGSSAENAARDLTTDARETAEALSHAYNASVDMTNVAADQPDSAASALHGDTDVSAQQQLNRAYTLSPIAHISSPSNPQPPQSQPPPPANVEQARIDAIVGDTGANALQVPPVMRRVVSASTASTPPPAYINKITPLTFRRSPTQVPDSAAMLCGNECLSPRMNNQRLPRSQVEPAAGSAHYFKADPAAPDGYRYAGETTAERVLAPKPPEYLSRASRVCPSGGSGVAMTINIPSDVDRLVLPLGELFRAMYLRVDRQPPSSNSDQQ